MRVDNHIHIRHIMLYHYQKGWKAAQSFRDLNELFGLGTISESQCREWFARQSVKVYEDLDQLVANVKAWIASKDRHFFARGIDRLPNKWDAVIEVDGEYAPE